METLALALLVGSLGRWRHSIFGIRATAALFFYAAVTQMCIAQTISPPLNLQVRVVPGGVELLYSSSWNDAAQVARSPAWASDQGFKSFFFFTDSTAPQQPPGGGVDNFVTAGRTYTYTVRTPQGAQTTAITYQPACTFAGQCPAAAGSPPTYSISCRAPADFYVGSTDLPPQSVGVKSFSGVGVVFASSVLTYACLPGSINDLNDVGSCDAFYQTVNVSSCHSLPPPLPKPISNCERCVESGRMCVRSGSGFICKGTAQ